MNKGKISVIIPVYKVEKYLDKCVESVVNQTYKNLEIILVDDGSPDNCPKMCDEWAKKDDRIRVIHKQNGGLSDARNAGLDMMTGDYVMFVDSDDYIDLSICEKLQNLIEKYKVGFSMCGVKIVDENKKIKFKSNPIRIQYFSELEAINQIYKTEISYLMIACAKLYRKDIFKSLRYPVGKLHEDEYVIHEIIYLAQSFLVTSEMLYNYVQHANSIMTTKTKKNFECIAEMYNLRYNFMERKYPDQHKENLAMHLDNLRNFYCICKKYDDLKKQTLQEYKHYYLKAKSKSLKNFLFYHFRRFYVLAYRFKNS